MQPMQPTKSQGVAFTTDISQIGTGRSGSRVLGVGTGSILDEERRLIDKVFSIVDRDNSGSVDMAELKEMFKLFGVNSEYLTSAISRIMSNVDKDFDGMISPQEFYQLLSQKFEKGDKKSDMQQVFNRMDKNKDGKLDVDELKQVSEQLGESIDKTEIKDMIKTFSKKYQQDLKDYNARKKKNPTEPMPKEPVDITFEDFYQVMIEEL
mmetsp:Transcript_4252/g.12416  ORF Transcript_4252/g.12416 Transcript_4252/m.12416 type:complete len:208 (+) Transcript_4252:96-719(+)